MRNKVIVSRGKGGVRGGLEEGEKYSRGKEDRKKKIPMKVMSVDVMIGSVNYQNLLKLSFIKTFQVIYFFFFFSILNTHTQVGFELMASPSSQTCERKCHFSQGSLARSNY